MRADKEHEEENFFRRYEYLLAYIAVVSTLTLLIAFLDG